MFDFGKKAALLDFTGKAMSGVISRLITMSGVPDNTIGDTKNLKSTSILSILSKMILIYRLFSKNDSHLEFYTQCNV